MTIQTPYEIVGEGECEAELHDGATRICRTCYDEMSADYREGFGDGFGNGRRMQEGRSTDYYAGYEAGSTKEGARPGVARAYPFGIANTAYLDRHLHDYPYGHGDGRCGFALTGPEHSR